MKCPVSCEFLGLNIVDHIQDNIRAQLNKIYDKGLVVFRHFKGGFSQIISLTVVL